MHVLLFHAIINACCQCAYSKQHFFLDRKPRVNILIEKEVQKEDEKSSLQKKTRQQEKITKH